MGMANKPYSKEEKQWLIENANIYPYSKLANMIFEKFGRKVRAETLCEYCREKLGIDKSEKQGFKVGNVSHNTYPIGAEVIEKGHIYVKISDTGNRKQDWKVKTQVILGDIPKDKQIVFLDGNPLNCTIDNLYCVDKKIHARLAKNKWLSKEPTITLTAIKWCELFYALYKEV